MPTPRPKRSRRLLLILAAACVLAGLLSWTAMRKMRQDDLDQQLFTAIKYGNTSEVADLLEQGADPNYVPQSQDGEMSLSALVTNLRQGRIDFHAKHGLSMLGYALNGFSNEGSRAALHAKQFKAMHLLPPPLTGRDPLNKMRVLLEHHADPNRGYDSAKPLMSANPLLHAVGQNRIDAVQLLLQHGADPDAQTASGDTARKAATRNNYASMLALMTAKAERRNR